MRLPAEISTIMPSVDSRIRIGNSNLWIPSRRRNGSAMISVTSEPMRARACMKRPKLSSTTAPSKPRRLSPLWAKQTARRAKPITPTASSVTRSADFSPRKAPSVRSTSAPRPRMTSGRRCAKE